MTKHLRLSLVMLMVMLAYGGLSSNAKSNVSTVSAKFANAGDVTSKFTQTGDFTETNWNIAVSWKSKSYWGDLISKGTQIGSASNPASGIVLTGSSVPGTITNVTVNTSVANGGTTNVSVKVGESSFTVGEGESESATLQTSETDYIFKGSASGDVVITWTQPNTSKAIYVKSITITYEEASSSPLSSITLSGNYPTTFMEGDAFSSEGLVVTAAYEDETTKDVTDKVVVTEPNMNEAGTQTVTVSYTEGEVTKTASYDVTITAVAEHTASFMVNGTNAGNISVKEGEPISFPTPMAMIEGRKFMGWTTTEIDGTTDIAPVDLVTGATMGNADVTYYAVYAMTGEGGEPTLTKMSENDTFIAGDNVVIVAVAKDESNGTETTAYGMRQETVSTSYVGNFIFTGAVSMMVNDPQTYWTVSEGSNGKWKLGDDTNGFLYTSGSNNNLYASTENSSEWTLAYADGGFTLKNERYLSCRSDLNGENQYLWRMGGTTTTPAGIYHFDIYKFTKASVVYFGYCTTVPVDNRKQVELTEVSINPTEIVKGETAQITVSYQGGEGWNPSYIYTSDDEAIAVVDENGTVTGVAPGETTITVKLNIAANDPDFKAEGVSDMPVHIVVLNAKHHVTFSINGTTTDPELLEEGMPITFPTPDAIEGFTHVGWATEAIDGLVSATPDMVETATMGEADVTFYAVFSKVKETSVTATFDASDISNLSESTKYNRCWVENNTGIELYLSAGSRYTGTPNTWSVTKGTSNYFKIEIPAGRLTKVVTTIDNTANPGYIIGSVTEGAILGEYDESTETQTVDFTGVLSSVDCFATADKQIRASKIDVEAVAYDMQGYCTTIPEAAADITFDDTAHESETPNADIVAAHDGETVNATVNRSFAADKWNTVYLPFALSAEQVKGIFGEETVVAGYDSFDEAGGDFKFKSVEAMDANVPYLMKPVNAVNGFTAEGVTLVKGEGDVTADLIVPTTSGFHGLLDNHTFIGAINVYYLSTSGKIRQLANEGSLKAMRAFFSVLPEEGDAGDAAAKTFSIDGEVTGIVTVENGVQKFAEGDMFNLAGQRVNNSYKGVVIVNGKKVIKK